MSETATPSGKSNVALIISLCVNLLLVGLIVVSFVRMHFFMPPMGGGMMGGPGMMEGHGRGHGMMLWQTQQSLSPQAFLHAVPAKSDKIRSIMDTHHPRIRDLSMSSIDARRDALRVFAAPNFDKNAFDQSLVRVQAADAALEKEILSVVSDSAATLSPEERRAVAAERERHGGGGMWRRWFHHDF